MSSTLALSGPAFWIHLVTVTTVPKSTAQSLAGQENIVASG